MTTPPLATYLRVHRLKSGMNQRELAELIGVVAHHQVSIHERLAAFPSLIAALSYQAVFRVPVDELFPGIYEPILKNIEERLSEMERALHKSTASGRTAEATARRLEWLWTRRIQETADTLG